MKKQSKICVLRAQLNKKNPKTQVHAEVLVRNLVRVSNSRAVKPPAHGFLLALSTFSHLPAIPCRAWFANTSCCWFIFSVPKGCSSQDTAQAAAFQPGFFPAAELSPLPKVSFTPDPRFSQSWIEKLECLMCQSPALIKYHPQY